MNAVVASYIVVASPSYGGAEKRFFDVYTGLRRREREIFYVAPSTLIEKLQTDHPERSDVFDGLLSVPLEAWNAMTFVRRYRALLSTLPRRSSFHYPLNCLWFLHAGRGDSVSISVVDCTIVPRITLRDRYALSSYIAAHFVRAIDVLSPSIFERLRRRSVGRKATLTPGGTFLLAPDEINPVKQPTVTFFGRLIEDKGITDFLDVVPHLWTSLQPRVPEGFRFRIAGYGPLEGYVADAIKMLQGRDVPIEFVGYQSTNDAIQRSAVVLSLQRTTNYPSRIVAEALMLGCAVVVRNSGDSDAFGHDLPGLAYCRDALDARELADAICALMARIHGHEEFCLRVHTEARRRFSSSSYLDYFDRIVGGAGRATRGVELGAAGSP